jgi:hypothetical protein
MKLLRKIGIITLFGDNNYGNRLQNYAVSKLLQNYGRPETIILQFENSIKKYICKRLLDKYGVAFRNKLPYRISAAARERHFRFTQFTERHIPLRHYTSCSWPDMQRLGQEYDFFATGSDQVWNPLFWSDFEADRLFRLYLLTFVPDSRRFSLSASIGIDALPQEWKEKFSQEWKKFWAISVREDKGAEIIRECCGRDVPVLVDPTLVLPKQEWSDLSSIDIRLPKAYAMICFLGNKKMDYQKMIDGVLREYGLECVELNNPAYPEYYRFGPSEFLTAVERADIIFTDSFHAAVFSVIFEKPFIVFDRVEGGMCVMNSRLKTLCKKLGLKERIYHEGRILDLQTKDLFLCDYVSVKQCLEREQKKMREYLDHVFFT